MINNINSGIKVIYSTSTPNKSNSGFTGAYANANPNISSSDFSKNFGLIKGQNTWNGIDLNPFIGIGTIANKLQDRSFWFTALALIAGIILAIIALQGIVLSESTKVVSGVKKR